MSGNRVQVYGLRNNASGEFSVAVDGSSPSTYNSHSDNVQCEMFIDYFLGFGAHNLTLTLTGTNEHYQVSEGMVSGASPVFHITSILFVNLHALLSI